jgi:NhaA family Na+:H+ antiporter
MGIPSRRLGQLAINREYSAAARRLELPAQEFIYKQGVTGVLLLVAALFALAWSNSPWTDTYFRLWHAELSFDFGILHVHKSLHHWINEGLMSLFFFLVGMEIKGELIHGYLSTRRRAMLPVVGALGGMIAPAILFATLNFGTPAMRGWGIPMATDIAFAVGVLALAPGISHDLKVFLLALAIVDDIGAILVIVFFYAHTIYLIPLLLGACVLVVIYALRAVRVSFGFPFVLCGILFWLAVSNSGINPTVAGVVLAFVVSSRPAMSKDTFEQRVNAVVDEFHSAISEGNNSRADAALGSIEALARSTDAPIERLTRALHPWVGFVILPLFAFANSGVSLSLAQMKTALTSPILWGVVVGLVIGKPLGITIFSWISLKLGLTEIPAGCSLGQLVGVGMLAGIGFTVAIFIAAVAYGDEVTQNIAKTGILLASLLAGLLGFFVLRLSRNASTHKTETPSR